MTEIDGWLYSRPADPIGDGRKIVTLVEAGMTWVGIRAWSSEHRRWLNGGEPERAEIVAWRDLPEPAKGWWDRGILVIPRAPEASATREREGR